MVSMVNWSSAILRYCNHVRADIQFFYPVPCWAQNSFKNENPVLYPSLVGKVQWSGLLFIATFRFQKITRKKSVAVKNKQCLSFLLFFFLQRLRVIDESECQTIPFRCSLCRFAPSEYKLMQRQMLELCMCNSSSPECLVSSSVCVGRQQFPYFPLLRILFLHRG